MTAPHSKHEILAELGKTHLLMINFLKTVTPMAFESTSLDPWSAADHLRHVLLSTRPLVRALGLPTEQAVEMFGEVTPQYSYDELYTAYKQRIEEGLRAEDGGVGMVPENYEPKSKGSDTLGVLRSDWEIVSRDLQNTIITIKDEELDASGLPHPAIGVITIREMLFFTVFHNNLHLKHMRDASTT